MKEVTQGQTQGCSKAVHHAGASPANHSVGVPAVTAAVIITGPQSKLFSLRYMLLPRLGPSSPIP
jgi:hypothetical protein